MPDPNTNFDPAFGSAAEKLRAAAAAKGITTHYISGVRSLDDQKQLYANYQAGLHGQPLPYPARGRVPQAAVPGTSLHERGLAADIEADDPNQEAALRALAPQFGLRTIGPSDPNHFEMARNNIPQSGGAPGTFAYGGGAAPVQVASADSTPAYTEPAKTLTSPALAAINHSAPPAGGLSLNSSPFITALGTIESNNRNIYSGVDKDYPGQPNSRSQGYYQIDTPTWQQFAAKAGIDTTRFPNAMSAPQDVQAQVASLIPLSRFGGRTQKMLNQQFGGNLDTHATIGQLASGTTLTTTPPGIVDPSIVAHGGTSPAIPDASGGTAVAAAPATAPAAPTFGQAIASGDVGGALKAAITKPTTKDAQGNTVEGKSLADKVAGAFGAAKPPPEIPAMQPAMPAQDPDPGLAPASSQLFQTVQQAAMRPLTWTSTPYGATAGQQGAQMMQPRSVNAYPNPYMAGMTLNSSGNYG